MNEAHLLSKALPVGMRRYGDLLWRMDEVMKYSEIRACGGLFNQSPVAISFYSSSGKTQEVVSSTRDKRRKKKLGHLSLLISAS